jgi:uncharacterized protein (TIGR03435 family)
MLTAILRLSGVAVIAALGLGQTPFPVATIKPAVPDAAGSSGEDGRSGLLKVYNVTLKRCIRYAYNMPETQILGGPKWVDEIRYDILAKADEPVSESELLKMLQPLLADRFKLQFHRERRLVAGYALTVAKGGIIAKVSTLPEGRSGGNGGRGWIHSVGAPFSSLIIRLSDLLQRPVVDNTEDARRFDFDLRWSPDVEPLSTEPAVSSGPSLFTALEEQLGLRLVTQRVSADVLVIDQAELPSDN